MLNPSSLKKIRQALESGKHTTQNWRRQRAAVAALSDAELAEAEAFERMGKRRSEALKMIHYERGKRRGWKPNSYPLPETEAHL